jgi:hypothetical protein
MGVSRMFLWQEMLFSFQSSSCNRIQSTSLFHFCLFPSSDSFKLGMFSKNVYTYCFVFLAITSAIVQNSKYSRGLLGSAKSILMPGLPENGKRGLSAPEFAHIPCCMLLLSLTFSSSSELTFCLPQDKIFIHISL